MKVTILGNNSALPAFGRHPTSQTVTVHGEVLMIDCGEGTQIQMQRYSIKTRRLRHIYISHLHGDHYFGLPGLINSLSLGGRTEPLHLYGPAPLQPIIKSNSASLFVKSFAGIVLLSGFESNMDMSYRSLRT